jgi:hypothetical protein
MLSTALCIEVSNIIRLKEVHSGRNVYYFVSINIITNRAKVFKIQVEKVLTK